MSKVRMAFAQAVEHVDEALEQQREQLGEHAQRLNELDHYWHIELGGAHRQIATERRLSDDRLDTIMRRFDEHDAALEKVAQRLEALAAAVQRLTSNGSDHG